MNTDEIKQKISDDYLSLSQEDILDFQNLTSPEFIQVNKAIATAMRKQSGIIQSSQEYIVIFPKDSKSNNNKNRFYQDALAHHAQKVNSDLFAALSSSFSDDEIIHAISKQKEKVEPTDTLKKALDSLKDFFNSEQLLSDLGSNEETTSNFLSLIKDRKNIRDTLVLSLTNTIRKLSNKIKKDEEKKEAAYKALSDYLIRYINEIGFDPKGKTFDSSKASFLTKITKDLMLQFIKPTSVEEDLFYAKKCSTLLNKDLPSDTAPITDETKEFINNFTLASNGDPSFINFKGNLKSDFLKFVMLKFSGYVKNNPGQRQHLASHLSVFNRILDQARDEAESKLSKITAVSKTVSLTNDEGVNIIENQPSNEKPYDEQNQSSDHILYLDFLMRYSDKFSDDIIQAFLSTYDQSITPVIKPTPEDSSLFSRHVSSTGNEFHTLNSKASASITKEIYAMQVKIAKKIHKKIDKIGQEKFNEAIEENNDLAMEFDIYNLFVESTLLKASQLRNENEMTISELYSNQLLTKNELLICFPDDLPPKVKKSQKSDLKNNL